MPIMLMESNLTYGSFHFIKMVLFFKNLADQNLITKKTQRKLLKLLALNLSERHWTNIKAGHTGYKADNVSDKTVDKFISELNKNNSHNAFYLSLGLMEHDPDQLCQLLLKLGAQSVPDTLGHSVSCYFPVVKEIIHSQHPEKATALLSYVMYLNRSNYDKIPETDGKLPKDSGNLLKRCASGSGIVNLHHMITYFIFNEWENAKFNQDNQIPFTIFKDWLGDKEIDKKLEKKIKNKKSSATLPESFEEFNNKFSPENLEEIEDAIYMFIETLENDHKSAVDWIFRAYTTYYTPDWDPHYFTSIYAALQLYLNSDNKDKIPEKMAIYQAINYFFTSKLSS